MENLIMKNLIKFIPIYRKIINKIVLQGTGVKVEGSLRNVVGLLQFPLPLYVKLLKKYK